MQWKWYRSEIDFAIGRGSHLIGIGVPGIGRNVRVERGDDVVRRATTARLTQSIAILNLKRKEHEKKEEEDRRADKHKRKE